MANKPFIQVGYGLTQALINTAPYPIVAKRAPTTSDTGYLIGTLWVEPVNTSNTAVNGAWILTSIINNSATWESITGGSGTFTSLTVTPGPISLTGTTTINTTGAATTSIGSTTGASGIIQRVGTGNYSLDGVGASTYSFGPSTTTGTITIGGTAQTGSITLGSSTGTNTINIGTGTGTTSINVGTGAAPDVVTIGSTNTSASTTIQAGTGGISLSAAGIVKMTPATGTSSTAAVTINARVGVATFTGFTTAAAASQLFAITNSFVTATSAILVTVANTGTNAAYMTMVQVLPTASSFGVETTNNGSAALNGNVIITFWVIN